MSVFVVLWLHVAQAERDFAQQAATVQEAIAQRLGSLDAVLLSLVRLHQASHALSQVHPIGNLALSFDHRAFDGAYASAFAAAVRDTLEQQDWEDEAR
jgi:hypothetical protein